MKTCSKCGQDFPATTEYFYPEKRRGPGALRSTCKTCSAIQVKATRDPEKKREYDQRWAEANRDKRRSSVREWRARNLEEQRERERLTKRHDPDRLEKVKAWRLKNPDKQRQRMREYREQNRDKLRLIIQRYMSRKAGLPDNFTEADWQFALDYFGGCCAYCGRPAGLFHTLAMDHFVPLNSPECPGTTPTNIVPACHGIDGCNNSKHDRDPKQWIVAKFGKYRGREILNRIQEYFSQLKTET